MRSVSEEYGIIELLNDIQNFSFSHIHSYKIHSILFFLLINVAVVAESIQLKETNEHTDISSLNH